MQATRTFISVLAALLAGALLFAGVAGAYAAPAFAQEETANETVAETTISEREETDNVSIDCEQTLQQVGEGQYTDQELTAEQDQECRSGGDDGTDGGNDGTNDDEDTNGDDPMTSEEEAREDVVDSTRDNDELANTGGTPILLVVGAFAIGVVVLTVAARITIRSGS